MISISYSNLPSFQKNHCDSIIEYCTNRGRKFSFTRINNAIQSHFPKLLDDFDALLSASPEKLVELKNHFDKLSPKKKKTIKADLDLRGLYNYFTSGDHKFALVSGEYYDSVYLAEKLDVFTCPYCNENYTYSFKYEHSAKKIRRTFDWDHLYPKSEYPFLAISFYNLIPSCKVCNSIKSDQNHAYFNPHINCDIDNIYFFDILAKSPGFISNIDDIDLQLIVKKVEYGQEIFNTQEIIGLLNRYKHHKELIKDTLNKQYIYNSAYVNSLSNQLHLTPLSRTEIRQSLFGIYFDHNNYFRRPFSKLISDILTNRV